MAWIQYWPLLIAALSFWIFITIGVTRVITSRDWTLVWISFAIAGVVCVQFYTILLAEKTFFLQQALIRALLSAN